MAIRREQLQCFDGKGSNRQHANDEHPIPEIPDAEQETEPRNAVTRSKSGPSPESGRNAISDTDAATIAASSSHPAVRHGVRIFCARGSNSPFVGQWTHNRIHGLDLADPVAASVNLLPLMRSTAQNWFSVGS
jgi:hypothetical protein